MTTFVVVPEFFDFWTLDTLKELKYSANVQQRSGERRLSRRNFSEGGRLSPCQVNAASYDLAGQFKDEALAAQRGAKTVAP